MSFPTITNQADRLSKLCTDSLNENKYKLRRESKKVKVLEICPKNSKQIIHPKFKDNGERKSCLVGTIELKEKTRVPERRNAARLATIKEIPSYECGRSTGRRLSLVTKIKQTNGALKRWGERKRHAQND